MKKIIILILLTTVIKFSFATHNRAGDITYEQLSELTYRITLITFTSIAPGVVADRPQLEIKFGDNTSQWVNRIEKIDLPNYYRRNKYVVDHTFPGPGSYRIYMEDPNRNDGVANIPNSVTIPFSVHTTLEINPAIGYNNSPILLNPPVDLFAVDELFIYNPAAFDPDGDSLSYKLIPCTGENGDPIPNYRLPEASDTIYIDPLTGDFVWDKPTISGIFNIAILIEEWRDGIRIGSIDRDIQLETKVTDNDPPVISVISQTCVKATDTLMFNVNATDVNNDMITLSGLGGPFLVDSPAYFPEKTGIGSVYDRFTWETECLHVRKQPYLVVFRAKDNDPDLSLVDNKDVYIHIISPPVENVILEPTNNSIKISWNKAICTEAEGYFIYRKNSSINYIPGICDVGLPDSLDFELIATITDLNDTIYIDNNNEEGLNQGFSYCYYITTFYDDGGESYASEEECTALVRGIPVITNVSIHDKINSSDSIYLAWSKPIEFDTTIAPGPYKYYIYRSNDLWGDYMELIDSTWLKGLNDTIYYDKSSMLDLHSYPYSYKVELYNDAPGNHFLIESPMIASSVFINIKPDDNKLKIEVSKNTPWLDSIFVIYRQNSNTLLFDSIGITENMEYIDSGLVNGRQYFYNLKSVGYYTEPGFVFPIENYSQKNSGIPKDTVPPCPPIFNVATTCDSLRNELYWEYPTCGDDVVLYNIYYSPFVDNEMQLIDSVNNAQQFSYFHYPEKSMAGCYYVTAVDSFYNESDPYTKICIDSCSYYELPNVFSPNGDGINDLFIPLTSEEVYKKFVEKISMKIYNRWGQEVSNEITDPAINWDGRDKNTKKILPDGVYYYVCNVFEYRLIGLQPRYLIGFIHLYSTPVNSK
ncbi:MAG: gliding motility-associated C-terminal domain-containing protein [Chlorobi bacterium]|nr:gliding motility-associated C-terminal domain-containing protein [Chlorobiota bacterium]